MIPSDFRFQRRSWWQRPVVWLLGEPFLGFLAIAVVAFTLIPSFFGDGPYENYLEAATWTIIGIFAVEYCVALARARNKRRFLLSPWRLLDLFTIVIPLLTLLPNVTALLRSSLVLRLLRLARIISFGLRASGVIVREEIRDVAAQPVGPVEVSVWRETDGQAPLPATWSELLQWVKSPGKAWYNVSNLGPQQVRDIAAVVGVPASELESHLFGGSYPHIDVTDRYAALFAWFPELPASTVVERTGLLLLATDRGMFTLSRRHTGLPSEMAAVTARSKSSGASFATRLTRTFLRAILNRNEQLAAGFERELRVLEELPVRESRPQFFEHTFRLKKELSAAQSDLWRLKSVLASLAEGRVRLPGAEVEPAGFFQSLVEDADYLYETVVNTREGLLSLIDLHLNVVSFEMNRVMRVLAVVSVLGLIPAVVGGLLGMNLRDNPWPFTLPQVSFSICLGMLVCLYLFFVKGWLR